MVFAICHMEFETLQLKTCAGRESCPVGGGTFIVVDFHLISPTEVITRGNIDVIRSSRSAD